MMCGARQIALCLLCLAGGTVLGYLLTTPIAVGWVVGFTTLSGLMGFALSSSAGNTMPEPNLLRPAGRKAAAPPLGEMLVNYGLVSKGDFVIGEKPGGGDHIVHARILSMAKWRTEAQYAPRQGFWRFFGSMASRNVGATEPRLDTDAEHDWREPPPGFPGVGGYDKEEVGDSWVELYK